MKYGSWNSTPSGVRENKKIMAVGCFLVGLILFAIAIYVLATEMRFIISATRFDATIVEVRQDYVPAGRGSKLGYIPVIEIPKTHERITVESPSEKKIYSVGSKLSILCDPSLSKRCINDAFFEKWWGLVDLLVAFLFLAPSSFFIWREKRESQLELTLNASS
jgi:hypothetical protein